MPTSKNKKTAKKAYSVTKKGVTYYLHVITTPRYYFSKKLGKNAVAEKPTGYAVKTWKSGLPFLKKS